MLGTNELKNTYHKTAFEIGEILEKYFVKTIINRKSQFKDSYPKLLLVTPPVINEFIDYCKKDNKYLGATEKSRQLNSIYDEIAKRNNCYFLSNGGLEVGIDGVHLTEDSHQTLAETLCDKIKDIYK